MLPSFIIIGAQKAATTFLQDALRQHSSIYMPRQETPFFEDPDYDGDADRLATNFSAADGSKIVGMKRPALLGQPEVPERIHRHIPGARLIAVLRNPIERAAAAYYHALSYGLLPEDEVNAALTKILEGKHDTPVAQTVLEYGLYGKHLIRYLSHFDRSQLHIIEYAEFFREPAQGYLKTCAFLGVAPPDTLPNFDKRVNETAYSLTFNRALRKMYRLIYRRIRENGLPDEQLGALDQVVRFSTAIPRRLSTLGSRLVSRNTRPELSPQVKRRLLDFYADDFSTVERLTGMKLASWRALS